MSSLSDVKGRGRVFRGSGADVRPATVLDTELTGEDPRLTLPDEIVEAAVAEGRERGFAQGHEDGVMVARREAAAQESQRRALIERAIAALEEAVAGCRARETTALEAIEDDVAALAFELLETLLGRELELSRAPGRDAVARGIALISGWDPVRVRLHPDDIETVGDVADLAAGRDLTVVADPAIEPGGCVVEQGSTRVDAQLGPALERVRRALLG